MAPNLLLELANYDYYVDSIGRLVIEDEALLKAITGALSAHLIYDMMTDVGCSNSGCGS